MWTDYIQFLKAGEVCRIVYESLTDAHDGDRRQRLGRSNRRWTRFVKRINGQYKYPPTMSKSFGKSIKTLRTASTASL